MGLSEKITNMPPRLKQLYMNIMSIVLIMSVIYGAVTFIYDFSVSGDFMVWFQNPAFLNVVVIVVIVMIVTKLLKGGKLQIPKNPTGKKTEFNIPDTWGVKKFGQTISQVKQQPNQSKQIKQPKLQRQIKKSTQKYVGTWKCQCGFLAIGDRCAKCREKR